MITLVFPATALGDLRATLWHASLESAAILLCEPARLPGADNWRLIIREAHVAGPDDYVERTAVAVTLKPEFGLPFERKAKENHWSLVYCHTHPHQNGPAKFSPIDDAAEVALAQYAQSRSRGVPHCALVFARDTAAARRLGTTEGVRLMQVGASINDATNTPVPEAQAQFDRQIRAFGAEGQERIQKNRIAIVGLGGTGSIVAQQLAYLGARKFVLIDRDNIEETNLNRTVGSVRADIGKPKVEVARRMIELIQPDAEVEAVVADIVDAGVASHLIASDFIFSCTDSHASRHLINQVAYQYVIPAIDMGVAIDAVPQQSVRFAGHVKALVPGQACLWCLNSLNPHTVRRELMSAEQRAADPYFNQGQGVVQPSVITLNSTVASLAATMFLSMVTGLDAPARYLLYDGNRQRVAHVAVNADPNCNFCGPESVAGMGGKAPLPVRPA